MSAVEMEKKSIPNIPESNFDLCFRAFPRLKPPADLKEFWQEHLLSLKKIPVDPKQKLLLKKSLGRDNMSDAGFTGFDGCRIRASLSVPRKRKTVPAVISFHDYGKKPQIMRMLTDYGIAHLAVELRQHAGARSQATATEELPLPGHIQSSGIDRAHENYIFQCFLDAVRSLDFLRLQSGIDKKRIAILGEGFGAAMAVFVAAQRRDVTAIALQNPGFMWLETYLQESESEAARELRNLLQGESPARKTRIRKNLSYLDVVNWAEIIKVPVLVCTGLADKENPPRPAFAFFNHLLAEKDMHLFPDAMSDPDGKKSREKCALFLAEKLQVLPAVTGK